MKLSFLCGFINLVFIVQDCWKAVNVEKGVFPGLFKALSCDNATTLSSIIPNVLPLLSKIPAEVRNVGALVHRLFLCSLADGHY